jgi:hypothetical protein
LPVGNLQNEADLERWIKSRFPLLARPSQLAGGAVQYPTFTNAWRDNAGLARVHYWIDSGGLVHLGGVADGLAPATAVAAFAIGAGYVPKSRHVFPVSYWTGAAYALGEIDVQTNGVISLFGNGGALAARDQWHLNAAWRTDV